MNCPNVLVGSATFLGAGVFAVAHLRYFFTCEDHVPLFKQRVSHYAWMQFPSDDDREIYYDHSSKSVKKQCKSFIFGYSGAQYELSLHQHKILLGILKKIEAKAGAVATIAIFAFAATVTVLSGSKDLNPCTVGLLHCASALLAVVLILSVDAVGHLGQGKYEKLARRNDEPIRGNVLQRELIVDAILKERRYDLVWYYLLFVVILVIAAYLVQGSHIV